MSIIPTPIPMKPHHPFYLIALLALPGIAPAQTAGNFTTLDTNSNILGTGTFNSSPSITAAGAGTRLMWYPRKAAFRAGRIDGTQWNDSSIGNHSTVFGWNSIASGHQSTAFGNGVTASGFSSTATGIGTVAAAMGVTALGRYNTGLGSATTWVLADPLFEIGNGSSASALSNAFTVFKNGNATLSGAFTASSISAADITSGGSAVITSATASTMLTGQGFFQFGAGNTALFPGLATFQNGLTLSSGNLTIASITASSSSTTGALTVAGGLGAGKDSYINGVRIGRGNGNFSSNTASGWNVLGNNTTGLQNTAVGAAALSSNTEGEMNTANGSYSLTLNTTGVNNTAIGHSAMRSNTTGEANVALGSSAARLNTTGIDNSVLGVAALYNNTVGNSNVAIGRNAGRTWSNGTTFLTHPENSIYIGAFSRGKNNDDVNSIVIGTNAVSEGANTTVIGNADTTKTHLFGETNADALKVTGDTVLNGKVTVATPQGDISMGNYQ